MDAVKEVLANANKERLRKEEQPKALAWKQRDVEMLPPEGMKEAQQGVDHCKNAVRSRRNEDEARLTTECRENFEDVLGVETGEEGLRALDSERRRRQEGIHRP